MYVLRDGVIRTVDNEARVVGGVDSTVYNINVLWMEWTVQ